jgi:PEP-CTERM motif-containing protein
MSPPSTWLIPSAVTFVVLTAQPSYADKLFLGFVTCVTETAPSCVEGSPDSARWRVVNFMSDLNTPSPGSSDLLDVSLTVTYQAASQNWHWDVVRPGQFVETEPFDPVVLSTLMSWSVSATLPRTTFDPVFTDTPYLAFVANSPLVSASATTFPPPLDLSAEGVFVQKPIPEPGTLTLAMFGLGGLLISARARRGR